jgi:hypothetical protein
MKKTRGRGDALGTKKVHDAKSMRRAKKQVLYANHPRVPLLRVSVSALPRVSVSALPRVSVSPCPRVLFSPVPSCGSLFQRLIFGS